MTHTHELLATYQTFGLKLLYWERQGQPKDWKGPGGSEGVGWNDPARVYPLDQYDPSHMNLGLFTGYEIATGKFLADVDLDWADGIVMAVRLLPHTGLVFGRLGKPVSHLIFTTPERLPDVTNYDDIADDGKGVGIRFVELRGGDYSHQTMIAPSLHSPGVHIELVMNTGPAHLTIVSIREATLDYAIGCLLFKRLSGGLHHEGRMALAGFLLRAGLSEERVLRIGETICWAQAQTHVPDMSGKDVTDMTLVMRTTVAKLAANKKTAGGPKLAEFIGKYGKAVVERLTKWIGGDIDFVRNAAGQVLPKHQGNIKRAIELLGHELSYNQFSDKFLCDGKPLEDPQWKSIYLEIDREFRFQPPLEFYLMVLHDTAWSNGFHPVKQYLDALRWDQVPRLDTWLITCAQAEDTPYVRAVSRIMLIAGVKRIRHPGCKYDEMVVWESHQGGDKSSAAQALCPDPAWFSDDLRLNLASQQLIEATLGKWIIEASDLAGKRKAEIDTLKSMMSRQVDGPARMAYAHFAVERPRHFIFIGTTNNSEYLPDMTGGRRFWPMTVQRFNTEWIKTHRDQLWAEACTYEAAGESIRMSEGLWGDAEAQQEKRRTPDPWETSLRAFMLTITPSGDGKRRVATNELWKYLDVKMDKRDRFGATRISEMMQRLGFRRTTVKPSGEEVQSGYVTEDERRLTLKHDEEPEPGEDGITDLTPRPGKEEDPFT